MYFSPIIYLISKGEELQRYLSHGEEGGSKDNHLGKQLAAIILCKYRKIQRWNSWTSFFFSLLFTQSPLLADFKENNSILWWFL
jgi:hypothetical protein